MNPFLEEVDTAKYDAARPYFHPLVVCRVAGVLGNPGLPTSLDVACGTGHSTEALIAISKSVVGLDESTEMLRQARCRGSFRTFEAWPRTCRSVPNRST